MVGLQHRPISVTMFRASLFGTRLSGLPRKERFLQDYRLAIWGLFPPSSDFAQFRQHVFPFLSALRLVRIADLMQVFNHLLHQLGDADTVRVSLLYMLEHEFSGKYP
uniref:Uncharacterized protein n=1 Tax=Lactuca sativa TaxID=4236 RepID=A0A9R1VBK5_LACSA|nr:hypothetical protein LSAT_V11C600337960 [Lactuca sativa]